MQLPVGHDVHLAYCLNVHPGATLDEMKNAALIKAPLVYHYFWQSTGKDGPYAAGIWLANKTARDLTENPNELADFAEALDEAGIYCFTLNGFPYDKFHNTRVKDNVYLPDWSSPARLQHTKRLMTCLGALLPENGFGSISTVPVGYREHLNEKHIDTAVTHLVDMVLALHEFRETSGNTIQLALEPEPDCLIDDLPSILAFFQDPLWTTGVDRLQQKLGDDNAREVMDRHLGLCLDLIHVGVVFEEPLTTLRTLFGAGVPVAKIQLGCALASVESGHAPASLNDFVDETYLHQTRVRSLDDGSKHYADLPDAILDNPEGDWRIHYHVPLIWDGSEHLTSTRDSLTPEFFQLAIQGGVRHFEVETYTLELFPDKTEKDEVILAQELAWVYRRIEDAESSDNKRN